jgi:hypothetical protein
MKICKAIPTILALLVLLCAPFSYLPLCGTNGAGGLVCYCCPAAPGQCQPMISCAGCKAKTGLDTTRFAPEAILQSSGLFINFHPVYFETASLHLPETVYIEVPGRPPVGT